MARYEPQQTGKSLQDIAAMMTARHMQEAGLSADDDQLEDENDLGDGASKRALSNDDDTGGDEDDVTSGREPDEPDLDDDQDEADDDADDEADDDADDEADDDQADDDDDSDENLGDDGEFEVDDETLVQIDDDTQISLGELKSIYNADRTVTERVKEATTAYQEASQRRSAAIDASERMHEAMRTLVQGIDEALNVPLVQKPNEALKQSNPQLYIQQWDAYQADQQRIANTRQQVVGALEAHKQQFEEHLQNRRAEEMNILAQKIPALRDEKTRQTAAQDILQSAEHYGFSKEEVAVSVDSRIYEMAYDAAQYRKLKGMSKNEKEKLVTKVKNAVSKQPKVLRSKGTSARQRTSAQTKRVGVLKSRAQKSGRPEDVAAYMSEKRRLGQ